MADSGLFDRFVTPFAAMKPVRRSDVVEKEGKPHFKLTIFKFRKFNLLISDCKI